MTKPLVRRHYLNARNFAKEALAKTKDYDTIMGKARKDYEALRQSGITCPAFRDDGGHPISIEVTKGCWNHLFKHPVKRRSAAAKIERAICLPEAVKLMQRSHLYQEVSREKDRGENKWLYFGLIGYIRGNRIKAIIRRPDKPTSTKFILHSFYQMSSAPSRSQDREKE